MSPGTMGLQSYLNMLSEKVTFSIFLCGCKLSGTHGSSNLSTLSAAKVRIICNSTKELSFNFLFPATGLFLLAGLLVNDFLLLNVLLPGLDRTLGLDLNHSVGALHSVN